MDTRKGFVISPIGEKGSDIRKHADDVFECIVKPALRKCGLEAERADQMKEPGRITEQMLRAIEQYDLCVAILSGQNPNVFYELAVAQCLRRPLVLLVDKNETIPFDVKDYRIVKYDLEPREIYRGTWVNEVVTKVKQVLSDKYEAPKLLSSQSVLHTGETRSYRYFINRASKEYGDAPRFIDVVSKTNNSCDLMGLSLKSWGKKNSEECLLERAEAGCAIRILLMDGNHDGLDHIINEDLPTQKLDSIRNEIHEMYRFFAGLAEKGGNGRIQVRTIRYGLPSFQLIKTDFKALCLQYFYSRMAGDSPLMEYPAESPLYEVVSYEFDILWQKNEP